MTPERTRATVVVAVLLVLAMGGVVPAGGAASTAAGPTAPAERTGATPANGTSGSLVARGLAAQGASLGQPVDAGGTFGGEFYARVGTFAADYNDRRPDLGPAGAVARGNVVNLHVVAADGETAVVSFRLTEDNRITDLRAGTRSDASVRVEMDAATFDRIATAPDPGAAFKRALDDGDVTITRRGALGGPIGSLVDVIRDLLGGGRA